MDTRTSSNPTLAEILAMPVHPMAARFPMWPADRLAELAADIAANGLNIPIVIWRRKPMLLDGRNRREACRLAGIEPDVEFYDGDDPRVLIISRNIQTREMSASQKAMLLAAEFPDGGEERSGKAAKTSNRELAKTLGNFSPELLRQARLIHRWASDQVDGVIAGLSFNAALKIAEENRQKASSREARLTRLQAGAPDLARQVLEDTLTLEEAEAAWRERQRLEQITRDGGRVAVEKLKAVSDAVTSIQGAVRLGEATLVTADLVEAVEAAARALRQMLPNEADDV